MPKSSHMVQSLLYYLLFFFQNHIHEPKVMSSKKVTKKALQFITGINEIINLIKLGKLWIQKPIFANMAGRASQFSQPLDTGGCLNESYSEWQIFGVTIVQNDTYVFGTMCKLTDPFWPWSNQQTNFTIDTGHFFHKSPPQGLLF